MRLPLVGPLAFIPMQVRWCGWQSCAGTSARYGAKKCKASGCLVCGAACYQTQPSAEGPAGEAAHGQKERVSGSSLSLMGQDSRDSLRRKPFHGARAGGSRVSGGPAGEARCEPSSAAAGPWPQTPGRPASSGGRCSHAPAAHALLWGHARPRVSGGARRAWSRPCGCSCGGRGRHGLP